MAFEFRLPDIGEGLAEAEVTEWLVQVGQEIQLDQPLVQIETDKAVTDIPAPRAGVLLHQGAAAGTVVRVGEILAVIGEPGERWPPDAARPVESPVAAEARPVESLPIVGTLAEPEPAAPSIGGSPGAGAPQQVLPLVRKLAKDLGVDLSTVGGTGPHGRITRADVEAAADLSTAPGGSPGGASAAGGERVRMSRLRRTIAQNMARSWREIPHVTAFDQADAAPLLAARRDLADGRDETLPLEALFIRAVLPALRAHPEFNATLDGEDLLLKRRYDIGVAVDTADGLTVAVVRGAEDLDLWALANEVGRLAEAVRARTATIQEVTGATFTVSNIGAIGGGFGTPIIPYGTTAILSFGRAHVEPVAREGRVEVGQVLPLSLSYDHRVIDGALGRRFLADVIRSLEDPDSLVSPAG
jgi:pyruvate dehydrogenase E2 component (dihydrolipoamide acetyltransferase)